MATGGAVSAATKESIPERAGDVTADGVGAIGALTTSLIIMDHHRTLIMMGTDLHHLTAMDHLTSMDHLTAMGPIPRHRTLTPPLTIVDGEEAAEAAGEETRSSASASSSSRCCERRTSTRSSL